MAFSDEGQSMTIYGYARVPTDDRHSMHNSLLCVWQVRRRFSQRRYQELRQIVSNSRRLYRSLAVVTFSWSHALTGLHGCRPRCCRNLFSAISGTLKLSDQAATSTI